MKAITIFNREREWARPLSNKYKIGKNDKISTPRQMIFVRWWFEILYFCKFCVWLIAFKFAFNDHGGGRIFPHTLTHTCIYLENKHFLWRRRQQCRQIKFDWVIKKWSQKYFFPFHFRLCAFVCNASRSRARQRNNDKNDKITCEWKQRIVAGEHHIPPRVGEREIYNKWCNE